MSAPQERDPLAELARLIGGSEGNVLRAQTQMLFQTLFGPDWMGVLLQCAAALTPKENKSYIRHRPDWRW